MKKKQEEKPKEPCPQCSKGGKKVYHYGTDKCPRIHNDVNLAALGFNPILIDDFPGWDK